jgi:hypothetical protein
MAVRQGGASLSLDPDLLLDIDPPDVATAKEVVCAAREGDLGPLRLMLAEKSSDEIKAILTAPIFDDKEIVLRALVKADDLEAVRILIDGHPACVDYRRPSNRTGAHSLWSKDARLNEKASCR